MKHSMLKVGLALTSISILIVTILLFSAFRDTTPQDIDEIRFSIIGAYETQVQMGMFTSPDGKSSSLTQEELNTLSSQFDATNSTNGLTETIFSVVFRTKLTIALPVESLSAISQKLRCQKMALRPQFLPQSPPGISG